MVQNDNFTLLLTSSDQEWQLADLPPGTDISWPRMAIGRSASRSTPLVLTSSGLEWQLADLPADLPPSTPVLTPSGQNGNFTLLLTFCGQEWQFHIATNI